MRRLAFLAVLAFLCACASGPPSWYLNPPSDAGFRSAAGVAKAYRRADARELALDDAVRGLARQKGVEVKSVSISKVTDASFSATMVSEQNVEVTISGLEIMEWRQLPLEGQGWEYYVLIRIRESDLFR
ncbi:MAG: hypothetical protein AB1486_28470 [Planctomycetota bacterium]